jgi:dimethylamine/trimethylamine dehydrogenase
VTVARSRCDSPWTSCSVPRASPPGTKAGNEGRETIELLAELPDLWDVNIADWSNDSVSARFSEEGYQERHIAFVKSKTTKPVVGVGRYTSPDAMVSAIRRGVFDLVGAARPSIADPFLPRKIDEGRHDEIRECIGCNICVTGDNDCVPIRCTQNPTMGEEWRRGWHPERIDAATSARTILVVGAGPAGLELTRALGQRGYEVTLAEGAAIPGGRVLREAALPGFSTWKRVVDHRVQAIGRMGNVQLLPGYAVSVDDVLGFGASQVFVATGARWRVDGLGRTHRQPAITDLPQVVSPDTLLDGTLPASPVLIYDDDHYTLAGALAERCAQAGLEVHYVTPACKVSEWTAQTMEQHRVQRRLRELGVRIHVNRELGSVRASGNALNVALACVHGGEDVVVDCASLVPVTMRDPDDALYRALQTREGEWRDHGVDAVTCIGDAWAPSTIAAAVHAGHLAAREFDVEIDRDAVPFKREYIVLD